MHILMFCGAVRRGESISAPVYESLRKIFMRTAIIKIISIVLLSIICPANLFGSEITGTISDRESGEPIPFVSVQAENTGKAIPCNDEGQYRLLLKPGKYRLKFSHITHKSEWVDVSVTDTNMVLDITLQPTVMILNTIRVYENRYDPAQQIIVEAIRHKEEILSQLQNYKCNAYTKETYYDQSKDDSSNIIRIDESQLECFWEQPDKYKEIIIARKQTANIDAKMNLTSIEQIPNFNMNRIQYYQYSIVSPTAKDALKYYNYYLLDTIIIDSQRIFRLEFEPKNDIDPLGSGTIDIVDSTFAVVGLEGKLGKGVFVFGIKDFHYSQRFSKFQKKYWMPSEIRIKYKLPGLGPSICGNKIAALYNYSFDTVLSKETFKYALEVADDADNIDSAIWNSGQQIPLTALEEHGYKRIDSIANNPSLYIRLINGVTWLLTQTTMNADLFHFNRVEGAYLGYGHYWFEPIPRLDLDIKTGYAFARKYWQYRYGAYYLLNDNYRIHAGINYRDEIKHRLTILSSPKSNPTLFNLLSKIDASDYYREKGYGIFLGLNPMKKTRIYLMYQDYQ